MISNLDGLTKYLVNWLTDQANASGTENGCVGLSGGVDSAVVFALCARAFPHTMGVLMPCHSSADSRSRAMEHVNYLKQRGYHIDSTVIALEDAFDAIVRQYPTPEGVDPKFAQGALRSCLRAPTLDYVAKCNNALIYGTGNRDEDAIFRYYQKRGDGCVDNNVLVGLHKSEVWQLAHHLCVPNSIISAVPTADLWGGEAQTDEKELGITYEEIEWVTRMNERTHIVQERNCYNTERFLEIHEGDFTLRQQDVITRAAKAEVSTKHKALPPPGPSREDLHYFVV